MELSAALEKSPPSSAARWCSAASDYPILRIDRVSAIEVSFIDSAWPLDELGEVGLPPVAPALVNAVLVSGSRLGWK